jgi:hypothetical protein
MEGRLRHRMLAALLLGPLIGLIVGMLIALTVLDEFGGAALGIIVGAVLAATLLALLWSGYSSLESPEPGLEPSDAERPLSKSELVTEESRDPMSEGSGTEPFRRDGH